MRDASVFVQHSITSGHGDKEGWPVAIAEASASRLPIVSTIHASIPEQVIDGSTGFLVAEGDENAMASAMTKLALNPSLRKRFGDSAREHIRNWDTQSQVQKLESILLS